MLANKPNKPPKFKTKNWVEIYHDAHEMYNKNSEIKFKSTMLKSSLHDYHDSYSLVKGTIIIVTTASTDADANNAKSNI